MGQEDILLWVGQDTLLEDILLWVGQEDILLFVGQDTLLEDTRCRCQFVDLMWTGERTCISSVAYVHRD